MLFINIVLRGAKMYTPGYQAILGALKYDDHTIPAIWLTI